MAEIDQAGELVSAWAIRYPGVSMWPRAAIMNNAGNLVMVAHNGWDSPYEAEIVEYSPTDQSIVNAKSFTFAPYKIFFDELINKNGAIYIGGRITHWASLSGQTGVSNTTGALPMISIAPLMG